MRLISVNVNVCARVRLFIGFLHVAMAIFLSARAASPSVCTFARLSGYFREAIMLPSIRHQKSCEEMELAGSKTKPILTHSEHTKARRRLHVRVPADTKISLTLSLEFPLTL